MQQHRQLDPVERALLARADGRTTAEALAADIRAEYGLATEAEVYQRLAVLRTDQLLLWRPELPIGAGAEDGLRALLSGIGDEELRQHALGALNELATARATVQTHWADPSELAPALDVLAERFVALTGRPATRNHGRTYGSRTLVYLECRRDLRLELGAELADALQPLGLLLTSTRWLSWRIRQLWEPQIRVVYQELVDLGEPVTVARFWHRYARRIAADATAACDQALAEFHARWQRLVPYQADSEPIHLTEAELSAQVAAEFDAPSAGWQEARWCSPDVMIAAESLAEFAAGKGWLVLGELHVATNTLDYLAAIDHHPDPSQLRELVQQDFPDPRLLVGPGRSASVRFHPVLSRESDYQLVLLPHTPVPTVGRVRFAADVPIVDGPAGLQVVVDGQGFDLFDLFPSVIRTHLLEVFSLFPSAHPRITIDRLVVARQRWSVPVAEAEFAGHSDEPSRFAGAQQWVEKYALPRHVFVKSPLEKKPCYVDFSSPAYVELLAAMIRRLQKETDPDDAATLSVTEMLPDPGQCWLTDQAGERYTSEFRLVAVDRPMASPEGSSG